VTACQGLFENIFHIFPPSAKKNEELGQFLAFAQLFPRSIDKEKGKYYNKLDVRIYNAHPIISF